MSGLTQEFWLVRAALVAFGLIFGSFLNVVIHRLPRGQSLVRPGSRCPACGQAIRWWQNLPVLSFIALGGRCGSCRAPIALRYPLVEIVAAALLLVLDFRYGLGPGFWVFAPYALALLALFVIDLDHQLLPDAITLPGTALGLVLSPWNPNLGWKASIAGALLGGGLLWGLAETYERLRGEAGLGGGDVKLAAMIGAFVGPQGVLEVLVLASLSGVAFGVGLMVLGRANMRTALPFGCFLTPAAFLIALAGGGSLWSLWQSFLLRYLFDAPPV